VAAEAPDLVLLDIMMPLSDGFAVLAGQTLDELAIGEHLPGRGEVLVQAAIVEALASRITIADWRDDPAAGKRFAVAIGLAEPAPVAPWPDLAPEALAADQVRPGSCRRSMSESVAGKAGSCPSCARRQPCFWRSRASTTTRKRARAPSSTRSYAGCRPCWRSMTARYSN